MANDETKIRAANVDAGIDQATGSFSVIAPGQSFLSVTEKIVRIVLTPRTPPAGSRYSA